jgi:hypothetical protein
VSIAGREQSRGHEQKPTPLNSSLQIHRRPVPGFSVEIPKSAMLEYFV